VESFSTLDVLPLAVLLAEPFVDDAAGALAAAGKDAAELAAAGAEAAPVVVEGVVAVVPLGDTVVWDPELLPPPPQAPRPARASAAANALQALSAA
jgi:hypothetical protein